MFALRSFSTKKFFSKLFQQHIRHTSCSSKLIIQSSVKNILQENPSDSKITFQVNGWARRVMKQKLTSFIHLDDGTTSKRLQIVVPNSVLQNRKLANGQALKCRGKLVSSRGPQQTAELLCDSLDIIGDCNAKNYEIGNMKTMNFEYLRERIHMRTRVAFFQSINRIRSEAMIAIQMFMSQNAYIHVTTPMITSNDCEGGGECFSIHTNNNREYFNRNSYLTVSGQLHLEALAASLIKVWTLGPVFRAEKSMSPKHLSEFYMLEVEESFLTKLNSLLDSVETIIKFIAIFLEQRCKDDLDYVCKQNKHIPLNINERFKRITYEDAISMLKHLPEYQNIDITHLNAKMEQKIVELMGNIPVFITHYPFDQKPFYMKSDESRTKAQCFDLLMPIVGEVAGGSLREDSFETLEKNIIEKFDEENLSKFQWYLDLRRFGHAPSGGFGIGFDRVIQALTGTSNIKDIVPFPRWPYHCYL